MKENLERSLVGLAKAKELVLTGKKITAAEAVEIGLANCVAAQEELLDSAKNMMAQMLKNSSTGLKYAKLALNYSRNVTLRDGLEFEKDMSAICYGLPDKAEGIAAFFEKRQPEFKL